MYIPRSYLNKFHRIEGSRASKDDFTGIVIFDSDILVESPTGQGLYVYPTEDTPNMPIEKYKEILEKRKALKKEGSTMSNRTEYNKMAVPEKCFEKSSRNLTLKNMVPTKVIFNDPATIVYWSDGSKTVVKCSENDVFNYEQGLAMAICKKLFGGPAYRKVFTKWCPKEENDDKPMEFNFSKLGADLKSACDRLTDRLSEIFNIPSYMANEIAESALKDSSNLVRLKIKNLSKVEVSDLFLTTGEISGREIIRVSYTTTSNNLNLFNDDKDDRFVVFSFDFDNEGTTYLSNHDLLVKMEKWFVPEKLRQIRFYNPKTPDCVVDADTFDLLKALALSYRKAII